MSQKLDTSPASFHIVAQNQRGAIVLQQKWSRGQVEARLAAWQPWIRGFEFEIAQTANPPGWKWSVTFDGARTYTGDAHIHRYGQEHDCLIFNFVAANTREGRVLAKLLERLLEIRSELGTDQVFDVIGEVFPSNLLERLFREMYVRRLDLSNIEARIVSDVDPQRFRAITSSTLEGLAKRELNLGALLGKSAEARERRLIPEVIEDFCCRERCPQAEAR